jgi:hypothetical protein
MSRWINVFPPPKEVDDDDVRIREYYLAIGWLECSISLSRTQLLLTMFGLHSFGFYLPIIVQFQQLVIERGKKVTAIGSM